MTLFVACAPISGAGSSVAPCSASGGVEYLPVMVDMGSTGPIDPSVLGDLFVWSLSFVIASFLVGLVTGHIIKLINSA